MKPSDIKTILAGFGSGANKKLGQHFLIDKNVLQTIVESAELKSGDTILEIGPGLGVLTNQLEEQGARVIAIEQDRRFLPLLEKENRKVIHGDAARLDWEEIVEVGKWKFVSNLPYSITSLAIRKALWCLNPPELVVVLIQREVAERATAKDGKGSLLSLMVALASSSAKLVKRVPAGAFFPPPKVESAILKIIPMTQADRELKWGVKPEKIMEIAKRGFAHPRKLLASNLQISPGVLKNAGLNEKARAEDLSPADWSRLVAVLENV